MRDTLAPIIEGFDCSGVVNRYSLKCDQTYAEGDNGGTLLDGSTITDALAAHVRLSWTLNSVSAAQYAALTAALGSGESPDTVSAYVFDPSCNAVRLAKFRVTRPQFQFAFNVAGQNMSYAGGELVLDESSPIARFSITPPAKTAYEQGDALDLAGLAVTRYDRDGAASDITAECAFDPAPGSVLRTAGAVTLTVSYDNAPLAAFPLAVASSEIIASGDWWTLYENGTLHIFCEGSMPSNAWYQYKNQITSVTIGNSVTSIMNSAFSHHERLTSVTIGNGVTSIGRGAFQSCLRLRRVTIPNSVTEIGGKAFMMSGLTSVTIPGSVRIFGEEVFVESGLISVTIDDGVKTIGYNAFEYCTSLVSVTIPDSVTTIRSMAFYRCNRLTDVYYGGSQEQWDSINIEGGNSPLANATIHYNSTGPT